MKTALHDFTKLVSKITHDFSNNRLCQRTDSGELTMEHYHKILLMIFHQTYEGPGTFSLAAAHCPLQYSNVREYLQHHADEEKTHWTWVIDDLKNTGYTGPDPRTCLPQTACQAYIAFNVYTAIRNPLARLAIAAVLESIGAAHGKKYATKICQTLKLKPEQAQFFLGHGDTDIGHTRDIMRVLSEVEIDEFGQRIMMHAALTAGQLYKRMYDEVCDAA